MQEKLRSKLLPRRKRPRQQANPLNRTQQKTANKKSRRSQRSPSVAANQPKRAKRMRNQTWLTSITSLFLTLSSPLKVKAYHK